MNRALKGKEKNNKNLIQTYFNLFLGHPLNKQVDLFEQQMEIDRLYYHRHTRRLSSSMSVILFYVSVALAYTDSMVG